MISSTDNIESVFERLRDGDKEALAGLIRADVGFRLVVADCLYRFDPRSQLFRRRIEFPTQLRTASQDLDNSHSFSSVPKNHVDIPQSTVLSRNRVVGGVPDPRCGQVVRPFG